MCQHAGKQISNALRPARVLPHGFCKHLIDRLTKPNHFVDCRSAKLWRLQPSAQNTGTQRAVFRHDIVNAEALREAVVGMLMGRLIEARRRLGAVAPGFGLLVDLHGILTHPR